MRALLTILLFLLTLLAKPQEPYISKLQQTDIKEMHCSNNKVIPFGIVCSAEMRVKFTEAKKLKFLGNKYLIRGQILGNYESDIIAYVTVKMGKLKNDFCYNEFITETDLEGNFTIQVPIRNRFLEFSQVGFRSILVELPH